LIAFLAYCLQITLKQRLLLHAPGLTPSAVGYWVGYRIVKSYYQHSADKSRTVREILQMSDPKAFLAKSGWYPCIQPQ
jgi:uncharacterized protein YjaZ